MSTFIAVTTAVLVPVVIAIATILVSRFIEKRSKREQREAVGAAFKDVVESLAGTDRVQRLGSAVLLRRFFLEDSEYSKPEMPYADEAIDVIAATLRAEPTGDVQKVLADGLAYTPAGMLYKKDFSGANLRGAYLSLTGAAGGVSERASTARSSNLVEHVARRASRGSEELPRLDVSRTDFFRADVSGASFRNDTCRKTVFYEATAVGTTFADADLTGANFVSADLCNANFKGAILKDACFDQAELLGANFEGAKLLHGATFDGARLAGARFADADGVPAEIAQHLDDAGLYRADASAESEPGRPRGVAQVFVSAPSVSSPAHRRLIELIETTLGEAGYEAVRMSPHSYHAHRPVFHVRDTITGCVGVVVVGLPQIRLSHGVLRGDTERETPLIDEVFPTPWNDIETGIAIGLGIPVLVVRAGCGEFGVFDLPSDGNDFERLELTDSWITGEVTQPVGSWARSALG